MSSDLKAVLFDLMGTCVDWHTAVNGAIKQQIGRFLVVGVDDGFAMDWRTGFFQEIHRMFEQGIEGEDIDVTHRRVLDRLMSGQYRVFGSKDDPEHVNEVKEALVQSWHKQAPWPDAVEGIKRMRERYMVAVLANGTTRFQMDIARSSGLSFDMLFSSELLGATKPSPAIYRKALDLLRIQPHEAVMVASHAYDLRAAKEVGMRTIYIRRDTEDPDEDFVQVEKEFDHFVDTRGRDAAGLKEVASILGA